MAPNHASSNINQQATQPEKETNGTSAQATALIEQWSEDRLNRALQTVDRMQDQITTLRLLPPQLLRTLSSIPQTTAAPNTGLPSPPSSPPLAGQPDDAASPEAVYARFEELAGLIGKTMGEVKEGWSGEQVKELLGYVDARGKDVGEEGWEMVTRV